MSETFDEGEFIDEVRFVVMAVATMMLFGVTWKFLTIYLLLTNRSVRVDPQTLHKIEKQTGMYINFLMFPYSIRLFSLESFRPTTINSCIFMHFSFSKVLKCTKLDLLLQSVKRDIHVFFLRHCAVFQSAILILMASIPLFAERFFGYGFAFYVSTCLSSIYWLVHIQVVMTAGKLMTESFKRV